MFSDNKNFMRTDTFEVTNCKEYSKVLSKVIKVWEEFFDGKEGFLGAQIWFDSTSKKIYVNSNWKTEIECDKFFAVGDFPNELNYGFDFLPKFIESKGFFGKKIETLQKVSEDLKIDVSIYEKDYNFPVEYLVFELCSKDNVDDFIELDNEIWTNFLNKYPGYISKQVFKSNVNSNEVHTVLYWENLEFWKKIPVDDLIQNDDKFKSQFGQSFKMIREIHKECNHKLQFIGEIFIKKGCQ